MKSSGFVLSTLVKCVFCLLFNPVFSQNHSAYSILFKNPSDERPLDILEDTIGTFYAVGYAGYNNQPEQFRGLAYRIKSATDTLSKRIAFHDTVTRFFKIIPGPNDNFIILGTVSNPPNYDERLMIAFLDKNLNVLSRKEYLIKNYTMIDRMEYILGKDNSIWLYGSVSYRPDPAMDFFLCKLNANGDTLKTGFYYPHNPLGYSALFSPDSSRIWIFGQHFDFIGAGERVVFDTNFNFISQSTIPTEIFPNINTLWYSSDKILCGALQIFNRPQQDDDISISFLDTALNSSPIHYYGAYDTIDDPGAERFIDFRDPSRIFYAGIHNLQFSFYPTGISWIMTGLLDSTLNPIYQSFYGGDAYYIAYSILATKDGGSIIAGGRYDYHTQNNERDIIFLKFDSVGSITGISPKGNDQFQSFLFYPNPGNDFIMLKGIMAGSDFDLYNQRGSMVKSVHLENGSNYISTVDLQEGEYYIYKITNSQKKVFTGKWLKR
jgi:hypothetical protein